MAKLAQDLEIEHIVVAHQPSVQSPRLGFKHVAERTRLPYRRGHGRMAEIGDFDASPIIPRERSPAMERNPRAIGTPAAANRVQNPSNSVSVATSLVQAS
jgi:hypothetical protein